MHSDRPGEPRTLLVSMRQGLSREEVEIRLAARGMRIQRRIPEIDVWVAEYTRSIQVSSPWAALAQDPEVLWAEPNGRVHVAGITPNDPFYRVQQWNFRQIGLPEAWVFTRGGAGPIAVIDTGVDLDHPDMAAKTWVNEGEVEGNGLDDDGNGYEDDLDGWDLVNADGYPDDDHGHGTHVAGIAAADTNNVAGVASVAWDSHIMALKVLDQGGNGWWADVLEAMVYAADNGASVLNLSLGQEPGSPDPPPVEAIEDAVSYARSKGCLLVAAAGNNLSQPAPVMYPAASPGVLAVAATGKEDALFPSGNRGPEVDVAAPGLDIFSTYRDGRYTDALYGTSMATPHVSGLAALLWSFDPTLTADQVTQVITSTARDVYTFGWDERTGWGRIDAQAAVLQLAQPEVDLVADPASVSVGGETAAITATVTYSQSQPVPDGLSIRFTTNVGRTDPETGMTSAGQVTATFSSTSGFGEALVTATVHGDFAASTTIEVVPHSFYLPLVWRQSPTGPQ